MARTIPLLLLLAPIWVSGDETPPMMLRVLTYNIHHGEGTDGRFDLPRLAGVMKSVQPDLVALQEVDEGTTRSGAEHQLAVLGRLMDMHAEFGKAIDYAGGGYGVAVLSRWPIVSRENHPLPISPFGEPRTALTVRVRAGEQGPLLQFTSTHLDHGRNAEGRMTQARYLNQLLVPGRRLPSILAGDMNSRSDTDALEILAEHWTDASAADPERSLSSRRRRPRDYVLLRPANRWRVVESTLVDDRVASDHRPLLAVLEWTGPR